MARHLFTSEAVSMGHPDKVADQISDAVLDAMLAQDPESRVACETLCTTGLVVVSGEITSKARVDIPAIVKPYIDYEAYGEDRRINEGGDFTALGYVLNNRTPFKDVYDGFAVPKEYAVFSYPFRTISPRLPEASA